MNLFDTMQDSMFDTVSTTMGYGASWTPSAGGAAITGQVPYNGPTEKEKLFDSNYDPDKLTMEYKAGSFPGLLDAAITGDLEEEVIIEGIATFYVRKVKKKFDGKTFEARLELKVA